MSSRPYSASNERGRGRGGDRGRGRGRGRGDGPPSPPPLEQPRDWHAFWGRALDFISSNEVELYSPTFQRHSLHLRTDLIPTAGSKALQDHLDRADVLRTGQPFALPRPERCSHFERVGFLGNQCRQHDACPAMHLTTNRAVDCLQSFAQLATRFDDTAPLARTVMRGKIYHVGSEFRIMLDRNAPENQPGLDKMRAFMDRLQQEEAAKVRPLSLKCATPVTPPAVEHRREEPHAVFPNAPSACVIAIDPLQTKLLDDAFQVEVDDLPITAAEAAGFPGAWLPNTGAQRVGPQGWQLMTVRVFTPNVVDMMLQGGPGQGLSDRDIEHARRILSSIYLGHAKTERVWPKAMQSYSLSTQERRLALVAEVRLIFDTTQGGRVLGYAPRDFRQGPSPGRILNAGPFAVYQALVQITHSVEYDPVDRFLHNQNRMKEPRNPYQLALKLAYRAAEYLSDSGLPGYEPKARPRIDTLPRVQHQNRDDPFTIVVDPNLRGASKAHFVVDTMVDTVNAALLTCVREHGAARGCDHRLLVVAPRTSMSPEELDVARTLAHRNFRSAAERIPDGADYEGLRRVYHEFGFSLREVAAAYQGKEPTERGYVTMAAWDAAPLEATLQVVPSFSKPLRSYLCVFHQYIFLRDVLDPTADRRALAGWFPDDPLSMRQLAADLTERSNGLDVASDKETLAMVGTVCNLFPLFCWNTWGIVVPPPNDQGSDPTDVFVRLLYSPTEVRRVPRRCRLTVGGAAFDPAPGLLVVATQYRQTLHLTDAPPKESLPPLVHDQWKRWAQ